MTMPNILRTQASIASNTGVIWATGSPYRESAIPSLALYASCPSGDENVINRCPSETFGIRTDAPSPARRAEMIYEALTRTRSIRCLMEMERWVHVWELSGGSRQTVRTALAG